jgi:hypothetical protein
VLMRFDGDLLCSPGDDLLGCNDGEGVLFGLSLDSRFSPGVEVEGTVLVNAAGTWVFTVFGLAFGTRVFSPIGKEEGFMAGKVVGTIASAASSEGALLGFIGVDSVANGSSVDGLFEFETSRPVGGRLPISTADEWRTVGSRVG